MLPIRRVTATPFMLPHNRTLEDIEQVAAIGAEGVGLYLGRIDDDGLSEQQVNEALAAHGVRATFVLPEAWTILPPPDVFGRSAREADPRARVEAICASLERIAKLDPVAVMIGAGASGDPANPAGTPELVRDALGEIADAAAEHGLTVSYEMLARRIGAPAATFQETTAILDELDRPNIRLATDVWHIVEYEDVHEQLARNARRLVVMDVCDIRPDERSPFDREIPGRGEDVAVGLMATLLENGFEGWWKLEVFSDDGTYGQRLEGSYWELPHAELLRMTRAGFDDCYARAEALVAQRRGAPAPAGSA